MGAGVLITQCVSSWHGQSNLVGSDAVQPQGVTVTYTVTELDENIYTVHSVSNKAKLILHDASVCL